MEKRDLKQQADQPAVRTHSRQPKNDIVSTDKLPSAPYKPSTHCP